MEKHHDDQVTNWKRWSSASPLEACAPHPAWSAADSNAWAVRRLHCSLEIHPNWGFPESWGYPKLAGKFISWKIRQFRRDEQGYPNFEKPPKNLQIPRKKTPGSRTDSFQAGWEMSPSRCRAVGFLEITRGLWGENWALWGPRFNRPCLKMWENAWSPTEESSSVPFQNP